MKKGKMMSNRGGEKRHGEFGGQTEEQEEQEDMRLLLLLLLPEDVLIMVYKLLTHHTKACLTRTCWAARAIQTVLLQMPIPLQKQLRMMFGMDYDDN